MLAEFRAAQAAAIARLRELEQSNALPEPWTGDRPSLAATLAAPEFAVIAEYKRASPSKGVINLDLTPEAVAALYAMAGASAISVLTEEAHFQGELEYLERMAAPGLPLLRKDFLLDPLQLIETAATPAAAALIIVRMFATDRELSAMLLQASEVGVEAVVEIFDERDLQRARVAMHDIHDSAVPRILQVNNRDLNTLEVDMNTSARLISRRLPHELWISASGLSTPQELAGMRSLGFDGALIGSFLMEQEDPGVALRQLLSEVRP